MKLLLGWLSAAVLLGACSDSVVTSSAKLTQPQALALAGRNLLVADTEGSQLRALFLAADKDERQFVRAPNPLFALSIPTAPLPHAIAAFTPPEGSTLPPLAFAVSTAASQVSVVSTTGLTLVGNLAVPGPDVPLSAAVARAEPTLVIGAQRGDQGVLLTVPVSALVDSAAIAAAPVSQAALLGLSTPQVIAASPANADLVAVGDRTAADGLAIVDLASGAVERFNVGGPVRALAFDPAGARLHGVLDASACSAQPCSKVFSFDMTSRASPIPVEIDGGAQGIAAGAAARIVLPDNPGLDVPALVVVSSLNGSLYFLDGSTGTRLDYVSVAATATDPAKTAPLAVPSPSGVSIPGAVVFDPATGFYYVAYQGGSAIVELVPNAARNGDRESGLSVFK